MCLSKWCMKTHRSDPRRRRWSIIPAYVPIRSKAKLNFARSSIRRSSRTKCYNGRWKNTNRRWANATRPLSKTSPVLLVVARLDCSTYPVKHKPQLRRLFTTFKRKVSNSIRKPTNSAEVSAVRTSFNLSGHFFFFCLIHVFFSPHVAFYTPFLYMFLSFFKCSSPFSFFYFFLKRLYFWPPPRPMHSYQPYGYG